MEDIMRKKILYGVMCVALSVAIAGCGSKENNNETVKNVERDADSNGTPADSLDSTDENTELTFDPSVFARSHMTVGGKKPLTEAGNFTYPITNDELDSLTTGYRYVVRGNSDDEEYKTLDEMCEAVDPKCEGDDTHIYSVAGGDARHIYPLNPDIFNYIEVINYSDEDKAPGELINDGYVAYHGYSSTLFDGDDYAYTDDEDKVDYIIEKLGNPDYIIDYDAPEGAAPDDVFEGGHYRMYDMIYDYGTYQICLSVTEGWYNFIDDGKVYSDYDAIDIDYTYYLRNGYLTHLDRDYTDYTDDDLTVTGVDGNVKFSEFVEMEKNEVVDSTASQETSEVAEDEEKSSSQEEVQLGEFIMTIDDYFKITDVGVYVVGTVESSTLYPGDKIVIVGENGETYVTQIESMEMLRKDVTEAKTGEYVGILVGSEIKREDIDYGMSVYRAAE
jgi:hypothetical protein